MDMFKYYGLFREEHNTDRLTSAETEIIEFLFDKYLPKEGKVIDTSAGTGTFAFKLAKKGYSVTAGDLLEEHYNLLRSSAEASLLDGIYCSSPRSLSQFQNESFDILISMGPLYHAVTRAERETIIKEAMRVLKPGGYIPYTYMTSMAMTLGQYFNAMRTDNVLDKMRAYRKLTEVEKTHKCDSFYGMMFDEMTDLAREYGIEILTVASTYALLYNMIDEIDAMSEEEYRNFVKVQIESCEDPLVAKYCMRGIMIGKKKNLDMFD